MPAPLLFSKNVFAVTDPLKPELF
ncbi:MAG: hypothetical protein RIR25_1426, partial [Verrucomicrobiota bacterium]